MANRNPMFNASGCKDPTAYAALQPMVKEDKELDHKVHSLLNCLKSIIDWAGFELIGRIQIKHKKSGKEFK